MSNRTSLGKYIDSKALMALPALTWVSEWRQSSWDLVIQTSHRLRIKPGLHSCNDRKHRRKHVSNSVPSSLDAREHFDYSIASFTSTVISCSVFSSCNDRSQHWRHISRLVSSCISNLNQQDMAEQLPTPLRLIALHAWIFHWKIIAMNCLIWSEWSGKSNSFQLPQQLLAKAGMWVTNTVFVRKSAPFEWAPALLAMKGFLMSVSSRMSPLHPTP